ncbi:unnamed protein product [Trifolium pratense]|uniref:Uncharacterized protein n=1 Tax=Trifolium pratense TaxID=57577 RepID=A0ACB0JBT5_TRIPR|nr:unnamed protein product [Trifolium pratense]
MVRDLNVHFHHGGRFVDGNGTYMGSVTEKECDSDVWGYFEIVDLINKLGYIEICEIWYDFAGQLKPLDNDFTVIEVANWARTNGKVDVYVVHPITQPDFVMDKAQPKPLSQNKNEAQPKSVSQPDNEAQLESKVENSEVDDDDERGAGSKKQKNKGGRPKKYVDGPPSKKRKERPKKNIEVEQQIDISFSEEDNSDKESDDEEGSKPVYSGFVMPKSMEDYKWEKGTKFSSKNENHVGSRVVDRKEDPTIAIPTIYRKEIYKDVYSSIIYPTSGQNMWDKTNNVDILPPPLRRAPGRPKRSRNKNADEKRSETRDCSRKGMVGRCIKCKQPGHNKTTCKVSTPTEATPATQTSNAPTPTISTPNAPTPTQATSGAGPSKPQTKKKQVKNSKAGPSKPLLPKPKISSSQPPPPKQKASATSSSQPPPPKQKTSITSLLFPSRIFVSIPGSRSKLPIRRADA